MESLKVLIVLSLYLTCTLCQEVGTLDHNSTTPQSSAEFDNDTVTSLPDLDTNKTEPDKIPNDPPDSPHTDKDLLKSLTKVGKFIYLPKDYDTLEEPPMLTEDNYNYYSTNFNSTSTTIIGSNWFDSFDFLLYNVLEIDEDKGIVHLELRVTYRWMDTRLVIDNESASAALEKYGLQDEDQTYIDIPFEVLDQKLWRPEFSLGGIISSTVPKTGLRDGAELKYYSSGMLKFTERILAKMPCEFDFTYYPADVNVLKLHAQTKGFPNNITEHFNIQEDDNNDYNLRRISDDDLPIYLRGANRLNVELIIRRKLTYHLFQTYFLSVFFVIVTWLCVLISPDMVELRIAIALSTLLSLTTMFTSVKDETPKVSYIKAIDIWMVGCIMFIFTALAGFTTTAWVKRSLKHLHENNGQLEIEGLVRKSFSGKSEDKKMRLQRYYRNIAILIERVGVYILSGLFFGFNTIYWTWLFTQSQYFEMYQ